MMITTMIMIIIITIIIMIITKLATCIFSVPQPANAKNLGSFQVLCEE